MKDMNYPIDIIWLDESFNVVHMEKVVKPDTYPNTFKPLKKSMYVLELRSGSIDRLNINLGDYINIKK
jgi:uncharacterized membrane protein (UPF0127 family)